MAHFCHPDLLPAEHLLIDPFISPVPAYSVLAAAFLIMRHRIPGGSSPECTAGCTVSRRTPPSRPRPRSTYFRLSVPANHGILDRHDPRLFRL